MTRQTFTGAVHGQVAAGDITNVFDRRTVLQLVAPVRTSEAELQAAFAAATGIWCPRQVRETFDELMSDHAFTVLELRVAWKGDALEWDHEHGELAIHTPLWKWWAGWLFVAAAMFIFLGTSVPLVFSPDPFGSPTSLLSSAIVSFGTVWFSGSQFLFPHRVGQRVRAALNGIAAPCAAS